MQGEREKNVLNNVPKNDAKNKKNEREKKR